MGHGQGVDFESNLCETSTRIARTFYWDMFAFLTLTLYLALALTLTLTATPPRRRWR